MSVLKKERTLRAALCAMLCALCLLVLRTPARAEAAGYFYCSAHDETQVLIAPTKIYYTEGQTLAQALLASDYTFTGLDDGYTAWITAIEGVEGNFTFAGDFSEETAVSLRAAAADVQYLTFSVPGAAGQTLTGARRTLIATMAGFAEYDEDVRAAAKEAYDAALAAYCTADDTDAAALAAAITDAAANYTDGLATTYSIRFNIDGAEQCSITAKNAYGRVFLSEDGQTLLLPAGQYTYCVTAGTRSVSAALSVSGSASVAVTFVSDTWLAEAIRLSTDYGDDFAANELPVTTSGSTATADVPDSHTGSLYIQQALTEDAPEDTTLSAQYTATDGSQKDVALMIDSARTSISKVLARGAAGNSVTLRASFTDENGVTQSQTRTLELVRTPTLSALSVFAGSVAQSSTERFSSLLTQYTYRVLDSVSTLRITPTPTASGYTIQVNGEALDQGAAEIPVSGDTDITITVSSTSRTTTYTLHILPGKAKKVSFSMDSDVSLIVVNKNGISMGSHKEFSSGGKVQYQFTLVPGEEYSYLATKNGVYHATAAFTFSESSAGTAIPVTVDAGDWLGSLRFGDANDQQQSGFHWLTLDPALTTATVPGTLCVPDTNANVYVWASAADGAPEDLQCAVLYTKIGQQTQTTIQPTLGASGGKNLPNLVKYQNAVGNTLTVRLSCKDGTVTYYTDYTVNVVRTLTLKSLALKLNGEPVTLSQSGTQDAGFAPAVTQYAVTVPAAATQLDVLTQCYLNAGYEVYCGSTLCADTSTISLSGTTTPETITLVVKNTNVPGNETLYSILVQKAEPTQVRFSFTPEDAVLFLYESVSGNRVLPDADGIYVLSDGFTYRYMLTKAGYCAKSGAMALQMQDGTPMLAVGAWSGSALTDETLYSVSTPVGLSLTQAAANTTLRQDLNATWADFRGTSYTGATRGGTDNSNNGVVSWKTPIDAESSTLYWATHVGNGYDSSAVSTPILVEDVLIVYAGKEIFRIDADTGEILRRAPMVDASSFAINGPTYYGGMVFVGISGGRVQAFDAVTLESLWVYTDPLGGQPNCPITVQNGYLYTGFWNGESKPGAFVCLSVTDEDPTASKESKVATWRHVQDGGFYWAGAYACDDYVMVGTDDGLAQNACLYLFEPKTGIVLDCMQKLDGDIRSSICYADGAYYFVSKGGTFYRATTKQTDSGWKFDELKSLKLAGPSTSTPVVSNGRAYIGVGSGETFSPYSGDHLAVIDLTAWTIAYTVSTQGYPQTSGLLTTGYDNGYVYVYFFDNYTPGKLRILRDKPGQTAADYVTEETYLSTTYQTAYALFTPVAPQAQYAIASPIADANGTLYIKNDSGYLMAFGSAVRTLSIESQPQKTEYSPGDSFDPTGLRVKATLANGLTRDVTAMMSAPDDALTQLDTTVTLTLGKGWKMYHNKPVGNTMQAGETSVHPTIEIPITMQAQDTTPLCIESQSGSSITLRVNATTQATVYAAAYSANGQMLSCAMQSVQTGAQSVTLSLSGTLPTGYTLRCFMTDRTSGAPLCAAVEKTVGK